MLLPSLFLLLFAPFFASENTDQKLSIDPSPSGKKEQKEQPPKEEQQEQQVAPSKKKQNHSQKLIYGGLSSLLGLTALYGFAGSWNKKTEEPPLPTREELLKNQNKNNRKKKKDHQVKSKPSLKERSPYSIVIDSASSLEDENFIQDEKNLYDPNRPHKNKSKKKKKKRNINRHSYVAKQGFDRQGSLFDKVAKGREDLGLKRDPSLLPNHLPTLTAIRYSNLDYLDNFYEEKEEEKATYEQHTPELGDDPTINNHLSLVNDRSLSLENTQL